MLKSDRGELTRRAVIGGGAALGVGAAAFAASGLFDAPGGSQGLTPGPEKIPLAFVMDDDATMIDFAGPWEVFQDAGGAGVPGFSLYTVAAGRGPYQTTGNVVGSGASMKMTGLKFMPDYSFANAPQPKVVVMGAQQGNGLPEKLAWIRAVAPQADVIMSVCTGAFVLAKTGLLDGLSATTHHDSLETFAQMFPKVKVIRGRRFVDNGKIITAGGLTSGVDAALHVVQRYYGRAIAQQVADYMEYQSSGWKA
jgi:transcriptional regulator GlxA family with amidase domain